MNKLIVSPKALSEFITKSKVSAYNSVSLIVKDNFLSTNIRDIKVGVACSTDFTFDITTYKLFKFKSFLDLIPEQPLTIGFTDNGCIFIKEEIVVI